MKKLLTVAGISLLAAVALLTGVSGAWAGLAGSAHDFSDGAGFNSDAWNSATASNGTKRMCAPCHVPHNSLTNSPPLWSHTNTLTTGFTVYSDANGTLDGTVANPPNPVSLVCFSCHDGTVALDASVSGGGNATVLSGSTLLGKDISDDHPISINYVTGAGTEMKALSSSVTGVGAVSNLLFGAGNNVECASCHDVHNTTVADNSLLRVSLANSELCLACHDK